MNHFRLNRVNVAEFGFEARHVMANYDIAYSEYTDALGNPVAGSIMNQQIGANKLGVFLNLASDLGPYLSSTLGFRADYFSYNRNLDLSPRGSLTLRLDERNSVTFSAGIYRQALPLVLLAQDGSNKNLRDLTAIHYMLGFERLLTESTRLGIDVYEKDYRDFPVDPQQPSLFLIDELYYRYGFFFNHGDLNGSGKARSRGVELILQKKMATDFYGIVSASYSSSQFPANEIRLPARSDCSFGGCLHLQRSGRKVRSRRYGTATHSRLVAFPRVSSSLVI
ncbi:MAG: TonB-dependent receptor [Bacteroidetes bacterium]|nr:TonB-dependent receptor [Bacteroidota bacterium]